jgi:photosystem II stability/assembly factor-like uncharacterized protein
MKRSSLLLPLLALALYADDAKLLGSLKYRSIGPYRGGRVIAVTGVTSQPHTYYFGGTGGGVFKTTDAGANWESVTDGQVKTGTVGAIAVSESDPNVVYAGMGEGCIRGNASHGDGVYKSVDSGKTWKNVGLADTRQIGRVRIHPRNPDIVWVAALGHMSGPNEDRGVFKSVDGGKTWKRTLFKSNKAGAIDLAIDPSNPNVMYAAVWQVVRTPYSLESGGPDSGLWKSTDGGDTWTDLSRNQGMPKGLLGRIGVTVSPANPDRVWAIVEADEGGVFRSDNAGRTWAKINESRNLRQRAWYYTHIFADPKAANTVYVLNTGVYRSDDGGRTYQTIAVPHGDNHDLWIAPNDPSRMIEGNDGGAVVSINGGRSWSTNMNQPTAQFYRVFADSDFPYNVYGAQQDNTTVRTASRGNSGSIGEREWFDAGGGESGWMAPDPKDSNIVYAGSYGGLLTRYDHHTGQLRNINVWPDNPMGAGAEAMKYRFQWNFPLLFSPHDPKTLYAGGNILFKTTNEGQAWEAISPDLTRNDKSRQGSSGGPITKDNTGVEYYCTIFTVDESKAAKGLIWTGSDDGLVYVTRDGGKKWTNVTPKDMPEWIQINSIDASPHDPAKAYMAATMYKNDDHHPYLYRTSDYGATWKKIVTGIPDNAFTRVIREDPNKKGLLFAGAETGLYMSSDDGETWQSFQLNLPVVPIADLAFQKRENDLVIATQGRAFWVFDDLPLLQQMDDSVRNASVHLFQPKETYRYAGGGGFGGGGRARNVGQNPPNGVVVYYNLKDKPEGEVTLEFLDSAGKLVKKFSSVEDKRSVAAERRRPSDDDDEEGFGPPPGPTRAPAQAGLNRFVWDMRYPDTSSFPGMIYWAASSRGPVIVPGDYQVRLTANGKTLTQPVKVKKDPRINSTLEDLNKQLSLSLQLRDKVSQVNDAVIKIRETRKQIDDYAARVADVKEAAKAVEAGKALSKKLSAIENELYQTKNQSSQDPLNYPIKLNNKIAAVLGVVQMSDTAPTRQASETFEDLATKANAQLKALDSALKGDLVTFNKLAKEADVPVVLAK